MARYPMALSAFLGITILVTISSKFVQAKDSDWMTEQQREVILKYESIASLSYGDKCNYELELIAESFLEGLKEHFSPVTKSGLKQVLSSEYEFDPEAINFLIAAIDNFTAGVDRYDSGLNRVCDDSKLLYCDKRIQKCQCGQARQLKGFDFVHVDGVCKFDVGSGCTPTDYNGLIGSIECRDGSTCVTVDVVNSECTLENFVQSMFSEPYTFTKIKRFSGYSCFCKNNTLNNF